MPTTKKKRTPRNRLRVVPAVRPNVGLQAAYRKRLEKLIGEMADSCEFWILKAFKNNEPLTIAEDALALREMQVPHGTKVVMAFDGVFDCEVSTEVVDYRPEIAFDDALPTNALKKAIRAMAKRWIKRFDEAAPKLADWFAKSSSQRSKKQLMKILKDGGYTVPFKMSQAQRDVLEATIQEQVGLIKSIPQKYLLDVQGDVMRSISAGRDLATLTKALRKNYKVTKDRAALIARDQNNKATATMTRARQMDLGITEAIWLHSHAGKKPRPTHLANDGKRYKIAEGWYDPDPRVKRHIIPGELINCRCVSKSIIPGFS